MQAWHIIVVTKSYLEKNLTEKFTVFIVYGPGKGVCDIKTKTLITISLSHSYQNLFCSEKYFFLAHSIQNNVLCAIK